MVLCDPKSRLSSLSSLSLKAEVKPEFEPEEWKEIGHLLTERRRWKTEELDIADEFTSSLPKIDEKSLWLVPCLRLELMPKEELGKSVSLSDVKPEEWQTKIRKCRSQTQNEKKKVYIKVVYMQGTLLITKQEAISYKNDLLDCLCWFVIRSRDRRRCPPSRSNQKSFLNSNLKNEKK